MSKMQNAFTFAKQINANLCMPGTCAPFICVNALQKAGKSEWQGRGTLDWIIIGEKEREICKFLMQKENKFWNRNGNRVLDLLPNYKLNLKLFHFPCSNSFLILFITGQSQLKKFHRVLFEKKKNFSIRFLYSQFKEFLFPICVFLVEIKSNLVKIYRKIL